MIDLEEINEEIEKLENCGCTTYKICEKLAILYIVREHNAGLEPAPAKKNNNTNTNSDMMMSMMK